MPIYSVPNCRYNFVRSHKRCFNCFAAGHSVDSCPSPNTCFAPDCSAKHHTSLHSHFVKDDADAGNKEEKKDAEEPAAEEEKTPEPVDDKGKPKVCGMMKSNPKDVYLQVIPVKLSSDTTSVDTYGILDSCSEVTLLREDVAQRLGLEGEEGILPLGTVMDVPRDMLVPEVSLEASSVEGGTKFEIEGAFVLPTDRFNMPARPCPPEVSDVYTHLDGIDIEPVSPDQISILIGADVPTAHLQVEVREGSHNQPLAINTPFGWTLFGTSPSSGSKRRSMQSTCTTVSKAIHPVVEKFWQPQRRVFCNLLRSVRDPLEETLLKFWEEENVGILPSRTVAMSREDECVLTVLEQ